MGRGGGREGGRKGWGHSEGPSLRQGWKRAEEANPGLQGHNTCKWWESAAITVGTNMGHPLWMAFRGWGQRI